jgi:hypothetical protein
MHSHRKLAGPISPSALLSTTGQGQRWERKHSFPKPSCPGHWDLDAVEAEICRVFTKTRQKLHAMWVVPCIANVRYPRAVQTGVAPINLEGPGPRSSPELPALGQASFGRSEREGFRQLGCPLRQCPVPGRLGGGRASGLTYGPALQVCHHACLPPGRVRQ